MPRIFDASSLTSSVDRASLTPPPLPRPPAWIWALTTHTFPPSFLAASTASSTEKQGIPRGVSTPYRRRTSFAWYSWIFIDFPYSTRVIERGAGPGLRDECAGDSRTPAPSDAWPPRTPSDQRAGTPRPCRHRPSPVRSAFAHPRVRAERSCPRAPAV